MTWVPPGEIVVSSVRGNFTLVKDDSGDISSHEVEGAISVSDGYVAGC